jgi:hypothetical protein
VTVNTYTLSYSVIAANLTPAQIAAVLATLPRDANMEALLGLTVPFGGDTTTPTATGATRVIQYQKTGPGPIDDPHVADVLAGYYTATFGAMLSTPVTALPVVVT